MLATKRRAPSGVCHNLPKFPKFHGFDQVPAATVLPWAPFGVKESPSARGFVMPAIDLVRNRKSALDVQHKKRDEG